MKLLMTRTPFGIPWIRAFSEKRGARVIEDLFMIV